MNVKPFCPRGHDKDVVGRFSNGHCRGCYNEDYIPHPRIRVPTPLGQFCKNNHNTFICGRDSKNQCRDCVKEIASKWRLEHPAQANEITKRWRKNNPKKLKIAYLKKYFNITLEFYNELLKKQQNKCAGCSRPRSDFDRDFAVDHDHKCCSGEICCGKCIRGLLCSDCNRILGKIKDNSFTLRNLADYIDKAI